MSSRRARPSLMTAGVPTASAPGRHDRVVEHDGVGGDDRPAVHDDPVQHDRAVADQAPRLDRARLEVHDVADHAVVADDGRLLERGVQDAVVLHARACTDDDLAVVAAQHRAGPDRAVRADRDGADHHGVGMHVGVGMDGWNLVAEGVDGHGSNRSEQTSHVDNCASRWSEAALTRYRCGPMSRRIEIELTSARPDGTWTWRAAGAREPKGVLDGSLLPAGSKIGSVLKADAEVELDGITILSVTTTKEKAEKSGLLDLIPSDKPFEAVTQQLAKRERSDRGDRGDRRDATAPVAIADRAATTTGHRVATATRHAPTARQATDPAASVRVAARAPIVGRAPSDGPARASPHRPSCRSGRSRSGSSPAAPIATRCSPTCPRSSARSPSAPCRVGFPAVRQAVNEQNARLKAEGKPEVPAAGLLSMAEQLAAQAARRRVARPRRRSEGRHRRARPPRPAQRRRRRRRPDGRPRRVDPRRRRPS